MSKLHVRKGDNVKILTGKDKGNSGKISAVNPDSGRVVVDGQNIIIKHIKARSAQQQSTITKMPGSIDASNVQIICPACGKPTRVAKSAQASKDGKVKWIRACKKCKGSLDVKLDKKAKKSKKADKADKTEEVASDKKAKKTVKSKDDKDTKKGGDGLTTKNADGAIV